MPGTTSESSLPLNKEAADAVEANVATPALDVPSAPASSEKNTEVQQATTKKQTNTSKTTSRSKVKKIILDSGAIFKEGTSSLASLGEEFYTIPSVISEIKDEQSRQRLMFLQSTLDVKTVEPSPDSLQQVLSFAKKTGDAAVLSLTDLKVIALTYMLEVEENGKGHIRTAPRQPQAFQPSVPSTTLAIAKASPVPEKTESVADHLATLSVESTPESSASSTASPVPKQEADDLDDDEGWITPSNIHKFKQRHYNGAKVGGFKKSQKRTVACITTDFAMQNVLLQMNLSLLSVQGIAITRLKTWAMRCHACFKITKDMNKQFCPSCGNNTLIRVSMGTDVNGNVTYYLKKNFQYNNRGTTFSIPKPKGGRLNNSNKELILREDQKEYTNALKQKSRFEKMTMKNADAGIGLGDLDSALLFKDASLQSPFLTASGKVLIGHGRRNVNDASRGRRRK